MSFIIPKKPQILYAPMLGSLGGGSVRGFGRGGLSVAGPGEAIWDGSRTYVFAIPAGVELISAVMVGGGAGADGQDCGGGGGLTWINNIPVVAGNNLTIQAGRTGSRFGSGTNGTSGPDTNGQASSLSYGAVTVAYADGGSKGNANNGGMAGNSSVIHSNYHGLSYGGGYGGHGGNGSGNQRGGGGGAGGYSGNGGNGGGYGANNGLDGSGGGGGGGGGANTVDGGQGGGVGIFGEGANGIGGAYGSYASPGTGGSGGGTGAAQYGLWNLAAGKYGGGSGAGSGGGGRGAVRIIWGEGRIFPDTNTAQIHSEDVYLNNILQP